MPRSPLPQRNGLDAAWLRTPGDGNWSSFHDHLVERLIHLTPERVAEMLDQGRFVDEHARVITATTPYRGNVIIWFHRDLPTEAEVSEPIPILYQDERIVVVDKPHFLSTIPRGKHVMQSVIVKLRSQLAMPELGAAHRLDRSTAGVLLLTTQRRWRADYQTMFANRQVVKNYSAIAALGPLRLGEEITVRSHLRKDRGVLQAYEVPGEPPNSETTIRLVASGATTGRYALFPHTGKTHQLRIHLLSLGIPIINDPLYPEILEVALDDFSSPLQLLASQLSFVDPVDGSQREYHSQRTLAADV